MNIFKIITYICIKYKLFKCYCKVYKISKIIHKCTTIENQESKKVQPFQRVFNLTKISS